MSRESEHTCHADNCEVHCPPSKLMCPAHWRMVDPPLQRAVWVTYRSGQERLEPGGPRPSRLYVSAADAAIRCVAAKEARTGIQGKLL